MLTISENVKVAPIVAVDDRARGANTPIIGKAAIRKGVVVGATSLVTGQWNEHSIHGEPLLTRMGPRG